MCCTRSSIRGSVSREAGVRTRGLSAGPEAGAAEERRRGQGGEMRVSRREVLRAAGAAVMLAGVRGTAAAQQAPKAGGTLRVALSTAFDDPAPHKYRSITNFNLFTLCLDGLTDVGKNFELNPGLAGPWPGAAGGPRDGPP